MKEKIRRGAPGAIAGHAGLAAVRIEDAYLKIRGLSLRHFQTLDDCDAVAPGAVMTITDASGKVSETVVRAELVGFKNKIIVAEALKFGEMHFGVRRLDAALESIRVECPCLT